MEGGGKPRVVKRVGVRVRNKGEGTSELVTQDSPYQ